MKGSIRPVKPFTNRRAKSIGPGQWLKALATLRGVIIASALLGLAAVLWITTPTLAAKALLVEDLTGTLTATDLANELVGSGITISGVTFTGAPAAGGRFSDPDAVIGFDSGIILGSGSVLDVVGPNISDSTGTGNGTPGDPDLDALSSVTTFDAAVLEFDFVPDDDMVSFRYVFASEEYNEFVNSAFNDIFAFFINGTNCATIDGLPISINTINNGNPFDTDPRSHPELYINNDLDDGGGTIDTEMDGMTVILTCMVSVTPSTTNHIKLAIADGTDTILDANVFLEAGSFTTEPPNAIELISFTAEPGPGGVVLAWQTASEIDNEGFNIWRSETPNGAYLKLTNQLIPAQGNADTGASYVYVDQTVVAGRTYYYRLEDVDLNGKSTFHNQMVTVTGSPQSYQYYLPLILTAGE